MLTNFAQKSNEMADLTLLMSCAASVSEWQALKKMRAPF
jgi:hypothetical protein